MAAGVAAKVPAIPPLTAETIKLAREQLETILGKRRSERDARIDELTDEIMELFWIRKKRKELENDGKPVEEPDDWPLFETEDGQLDPLEERIYELVTILSEVLKRDHPDKYGTSLEFKRKMARDFMKEFEFWLMNDALDEEDDGAEEKDEDGKEKKPRGKIKGKENEDGIEGGQNDKQKEEEERMLRKMEKAAKKMKEKKWDYP